MGLDLKLISMLLRDIILPIFAILLAGVSVVIGYKKGLLEIKIKHPEDKIPKITGNGNVINIAAASKTQGMAYFDPQKFDEYHQQSISQCRISFWFSLIFASIGFLLIATSVISYSDKTGYLGIVAGTIIDAVSALFFVQSNKARQLMSEFFDRLRHDRKLEESLNLCNSIDDWFFRNSVKVKLSLYFSGLDDSSNIASEIIALGKDELERKRDRISVDTTVIQEKTTKKTCQSYDSATVQSTDTPLGA
jgi:hypothetical protein